MEKLSKEKLEWMKEVGIVELPKPMKYSLGGKHLYSEEYIKNTPLEELKERHEQDFDLIDFENEIKTEEDF